jgi:hypothetical protein
MIDKKIWKMWQYLNCFGSLINDAKFEREIKSRIVMATAAFSNKKALVAGRWYLS